MARRAWSLLLTALACTLALVSCAEADSSEKALPVRPLYMQNRPIFSPPSL